MIQAKKYLFHYKKYGLLSHLSHLETMKMIERLLRRTGLKFEQTQGFHQRMKLSFAQALPTGIIDLAGLFVAFTFESVDDLFARKANSLSPNGLEIVEVEEVESTFKLSKVLKGYEFEMIFLEPPPSTLDEEAKKVNDLWVVRTFRPFNSSVPKSGEFGQFLTIRSKAVLSEVQVD